MGLLPGKVRVRDYVWAAPSEEDSITVELDPRLVQTIGARAKRAIRARMRALRQALPPSARSARSQRIVEQLVDCREYREASSVALYAPLVQEVDIAKLAEHAQSEQKRLYYPFMDEEAGGFTTGFRLVTDSAQLVERGRGFLEPSADLPCAERGDIQLVVVPALAVSAAGQRLGFGSGFYDATLPDICPPAISLAVAFDFQLLAELPEDPHDVRIHTIVTDQRLLRPGDSAPAGAKAAGR